MFNYSLHGYEENCILTHEINYTQLEFEQMCKEAPLLDAFGLYKSYDSIAIHKYLIDKYGFKPLEYQAGFFVDGESDIETEVTNHE